MAFPNKIVFLMIRYSILSRKTSGSWVISSRYSVDEYKNKLFSEKRLELHERLFSKITLPSIVNNRKNSPKDTVVKPIIMTSRSLPDKAKRFLLEAKEKEPSLEIMYVGQDDDYNKKALYYIRDYLKNNAAEKGMIATIRLDDDDALSDDYVTQLYSYMSLNMTDFCVSFGRGFYAHHVSKELVLYTDCYYPKSPVGLAFLQKYDLKSSDVVTKSVFDTGSHGKVDQQYQTFLDSRKLAFLYSIHSESDVALRIEGRGKEIANIIQNKKIYSASKVKKSFSSIPVKDNAALRLITAHGNVVCWHKERELLVQTPIDESSKFDEVYVDTASGQLLTANGDTLTWRNNGVRLSKKGDKDIYVKVTEDNKYILFITDDVYIGANREGGFKVGTDVKAWEIYTMA